MGTVTILDFVIICICLNITGLNIAGLNAAIIAKNSFLANAYIMSLSCALPLLPGYAMSRDNNFKSGGAYFGLSSIHADKAGEELSDVIPVKILYETKILAMGILKFNSVLHNSLLIQSKKL